MRTKTKKVTEYRVYENGTVIATYTKKKFAQSLAKQGTNRTIEKVEVLSTEFY